MRKEIDPALTPRGKAFEFWMSSPMPMVTMTKTFDVSHLVKKSKKKKWKFNMSLCWAIGCAACRMKEFYLLPENTKGKFSERGRLMQYHGIAINVIVRNRKGGINSSDISYSEDIEQFNCDYLQLTSQAATLCESSFLEDAMVVGTSAMIEAELGSIVNQYTDKFCNPMLLWGRYRRGFWRTTLPISFQFHHVQMDGGDAATFMELLQAIMKVIQFLVMKQFRLRIGAGLHFLIAIGHLACLFFLEEAFKAYGIWELMKFLCFGHIWALYVITVFLAIDFALAGVYALSASGDIIKLPLQRFAIITIIGVYSIRTIVGIYWLIGEFSYLQFFSTLVSTILVWCYLPGVYKIRK